MLKAFNIKKGDVFGQLTVVSDPIKPRKDGKFKNRETFICKCSCGTELECSGTNLRNGRSKNCWDCAWRFRSENSKNQVSQMEQLYNNRIVIRCRDSKHAIENNLSLEDFSKIVSQNCAYCGQPPRYIKMFNNRKYNNSNDFFANGIDRIDNDKGYSIENCVPSCTDCNRMKLDMTRENFLNKISQINNYLKLN